ncbi:uncharacterized protein EURHEDRAFT_220568 [Aspergillus ruber CBS 135680]|uniref:Uncharacterized protein n=1 Tax=Aspergillus ruber (strain CBS 135680) TaxID=1388766 RepID=A0A017SPZ1_ASPRC|nr:uncharacterized protein EURHEDRAFT_220568 [Aspergillus ruber CBS 135680]EYE98679.1 hypothetical protein EURHEDRAFT_220568 [Aspergillus ruber CBS 135680]
MDMTAICGPALHRILYHAYAYSAIYNCRDLFYPGFSVIVFIYGYSILLHTDRIIQLGLHSSIDIRHHFFRTLLGQTNQYRTSLLCNSISPILNS